MLRYVEMYLTDVAAVLSYERISGTKLTFSMVIDLILERVKDLQRF